MGSIAILSDIVDAVVGPIQGIVEFVATVIGDAFAIGSGE
jgi:hypothetical protein